MTISYSLGFSKRSSRVAIRRVRLPVVFTCVSLVWCLHGQELPSNALALKKNYEQAVERATAPLTEKYLSELEKLKQNAVRAGDAVAITAISSELESIKANAAKSLDAAMTLREKLIGSLWLGTEKHLNGWVVRFVPTGGIDMTRPDGSQGYTGWTWSIDDRNDLYITITNTKAQKVALSKRVDSIVFGFGTLIKQK